MSNKEELYRLERKTRKQMRQDETELLVCLLIGLALIGILFL